MKMTLSCPGFTRTLFIALSALLFLLAGPGSLFASAQAPRPWPIITFTCDKENRQVKIKNEVKWGESGRIYPFNAAQGTYNPWSLVQLEPRGSRTLVSESDQLKLSCHLEGTDYRIVVRPKIFNHNFNARCGDRLSVIVSVFADETALLDEKPLEAFCHGNTNVIRGIKVLADNKTVKIYEVPRSRFY